MLAIEGGAPAWEGRDEEENGDEEEEEEGGEEGRDRWALMRCTRSIVVHLLLVRYESPASSKGELVVNGGKPKSGWSEKKCF